MASALDRLKMADSYSRMEALLGLQLTVPDAVFWQFVGQEWSGCDNIHTYGRDLQWLIECRLSAGGYPIVEAMDEDARRAFAALPERVALFRGCYARNKSGLSWSLSRDVASKFPFLNRYRGRGQALLLSTVVSKRNIAFMISDRTEAEVIVLPRHRRIRSCETITEKQQ